MPSPPACGCTGTDTIWNPTATDELMRQCYFDHAMLRSVAKRLYDRSIRDHLPRKIKVYNGVALRIGRLLDTNVVDPDYKEGTVGPLREHTVCGDRITVIGGGFGVSTVVAAHIGEVTVYEGGLDMVEIIEDTVRLNRVEDAVEVRTAIVSEGNDVYGDSIADERVSPRELEPCDVLEMDCEGAEKRILEEMDIEPRVIVVECHPTFGVDPQGIRELLEDRGYDVVNRWELDGGNVTFTALSGSSEQERK